MSDCLTAIGSGSSTVRIKSTITSDCRARLIEATCIDDRTYVFPWLTMLFVSRQISPGFFFFLFLVLRHNYSRNSILLREAEVAGYLVRYSLNEKKKQQS